METRPATVELYGSFQLDTTELALPVAALQEVVNYPATVTRMPLSPAHLLGLFNLRGTLIPIVDLRPLLGLPDSSVDAGRKVAIVELGDMRIGLLFDATGEILRVPAEQKIDLATAEPGRAVICGALKLNGGERILQILSAAALLGLPDVPQPLRNASREGRRAQQTQHAQRRQTVSFVVAGAHLALPMASIQEIIRVPALHPSPLADAICVGMLNLRGSTVPVLDFARFVGLIDATPPGRMSTCEPGTPGDLRRIVILAQRDAHVGLLVDEVRSIVGYRDDELLPMPAYARRDVALFAGCLDRAELDSILLLNPDALLADPQIDALVTGHRELYRAADSARTDTENETSRHGRRRGPRETYVTFRLGHLLGVRIGQLREVIGYPADVVKTPGAPSFIRGVANLRRELVTVIDVRAMLGMPPYADLDTARLLIVEHRDGKYGLVVDAVDNIVTIDGGDRIPVPSMLTGLAAAGLRGSMKEAVEVPGIGTLLLIDLASLCEHATLEAIA
jgi:purine-binding chemotaxis protein CheW